MLLDFKPKMYTVNLQEMVTQMIPFLDVLSFFSIVVTQL